MIHGGQQHDPSTGAVMPPIYQTTTYAQASPGDHKGYEYSRTGNPTRTALENALSSIENGGYGLAFASGLAAIDAVMKLLQPGDEVISTNDLYGGTFRLFSTVFQKFGIEFHFVAMDDTENIEKLINKKVKVIHEHPFINDSLEIESSQPERKHGHKRKPKPASSSKSQGNSGGKNNYWRKRKTGGPRKPSQK